MPRSVIQVPAIPVGWGHAWVGVTTHKHRPQLCCHFSHGGTAPPGAPAQAASKVQAAAGPGRMAVAALPRRQGLARAPGMATHCSCWESGTHKLACLTAATQRHSIFFNSSFWRIKAYHIASLIGISSPYFLFYELSVLRLNGTLNENLCTLEALVHNSHSFLSMAAPGSSCLTDHENCPYLF